MTELRWKLVVICWAVAIFVAPPSDHARSQEALPAVVAIGFLAQGEPAAPGRPVDDMNFIEQLFASGIILPVGLLILFYAIFLAPERRRKAEEAKMLAAIKKNDRVVTVGGIHATVANVASDSDIVTLKIDESTGTKIRVNRSAIARVVVETSPGTSISKDATDEKNS